MGPVIASTSQTFVAADLVRAVLGGGFVELVVATVVVSLVVHGPHRCATAAVHALSLGRARRGASPESLLGTARTLRLAERTWLGLGLVLIVLPIFGQIAGLSDALRTGNFDGLTYAPMKLPLMMTNLLIGRMLLGGCASGALHRAFALGQGLGEDELRRDRAGDLLVFAHLLVPPMWLPLMFYSFPVR